MSKINKPLLKAQSFIHEIVAEGMQQDQTTMDVVQFATEILGVRLWPTQRAILKALYNLPLEKGLWRDLCINLTGRTSAEREEEIFSWCSRYDMHPDDPWDEREILQQWSLDNKTTWVEGQEYQELCLECGMRGSKTSLTSIMVTFEFYKLLQLKDPAASFGLMAGSLIAFLVLATSEKQSKDTLFAAVKGRIEHSPYFQGLMATGVIQVNALEIYCESKNLLLWAGHSRSEGLVGRTLMIFAMDEGNRFGVEAQGGASGAEMYANVGKGVTTLQKFGSKRIVISSAWAEGDITDTMYEMAETEEGANILAFRLCTWDINPEFAKLGEEHPFMRKEFAARGIEAQRDYAGVRPGSEESYFQKPLVQKVTTRMSLPVGYEAIETQVVGPDGVQIKAGIKIHVDRDAISVPIGFQSYAHGDPGLKKDSFGFVAASPFYDAATGLVHADVHTILKWQPLDKGRKNIYPTDFMNVEEIILELAPYITLRDMTFDHWQSAMIIQRLYSKGVNTREWKSSFSQQVQRDIYLTLRDWLYAERIQLPDPSVSPAAAQLHKELIELKLMNGRRIDHPKPRGSKDLSDCLACVIYKIAQDERKYRSFEVGSDKMRTVGKVRAAGVISDIFDEGRAMAARSNQRLINNAPRNAGATIRTMGRKTSVTQADW
jgi:hypothetical protein